MNTAYNTTLSWLIKALGKFIQPEDSLDTGLLLPFPISSI